MLSVKLIREVLNRRDPQGFIKLGAPADEYDLEARLIFTMIEHSEHRLLTKEMIHRIVFDVFVETFGLMIAGDKQSYSDVADDIYNHFMMKVGKRNGRN